LNTLLHFVLYICNKQIRLKTENKARNSFTDRYGRHRFYYEDKEICNNFNGSKGSPRPTVLLHMSFLNAKRQAIHKTNVENPFHHSLWHLNEGSPPPPQANISTKKWLSDFPFHATTLIC
jgi:hypothetical protein